MAWQDRERWPDNDLETLVFAGPGPAQQTVKNVDTAPGGSVTGSDGLGRPRHGEVTTPSRPDRFVATGEASGRGYPSHGVRQQRTLGAHGFPTAYSHCTTDGILAE